MTHIYGWDASHYDGTLTTEILTKARAEGIEFFTHKLGEGAGNVDTTAKTALAAARAAGILVIGGYWFCHNSDDPVAEADRMIARADADEPWWREFPGWFWQADCETEAGAGKPSAAWIKKFADRLVAKTGKRCIVYASHGEYGNALAGVGHLLWNANYPSSRKAGFTSLYPGDSYPGWAKYSDQIPAICQFSSSAIIGGRTTCDANAFRGTVAQLLTLIGAPTPQPLEDDMSDIQVTVPANYAKPGTKISIEDAIASLMKYNLDVRNNTLTIISLLGDSAKVETAIAAAMKTLPTGVEVTAAALQAALVGALQQFAAPAPAP